MAIAGGQILGDEYTEHVIKVCAAAFFTTLELGHYHLLYIEQERHNPPRKVQLSTLLKPSNPHVTVHRSTLLKSDQWLRRQTVEDSIRGAINFRQTPNSNIYALGQPTVEAVDEVVSRIKFAHPDAPRIVWITLREEPVVYINGAPYCLRREGFSLRNMKGTSCCNYQRRFLHFDSS